MNQRFQINKKANLIRAKLLIFSNNELNLNKKNQKKFLINSKSLESYENKIEDYIITEHNSYIYLNEENEKKNNNSPDLYYEYSLLRNSSPVLLKTKRMRLTKHPDKISCRKLSDSIEIHIKRTEKKRKEMENNIKFLRNLSNQYKSFVEIEHLKINKCNSNKKKKKKNTHNSQLHLSKYKFNNDDKKSDKSIIKLHKMYKSKKKSCSKRKKNQNICINNDIFGRTEVFSMRDCKNFYFEFKQLKI